MSGRKYFVHELKKALPAIGSIALIMTAIMVTTVLTYRFEESWGWVNDRAESGLETIMFMGGALAAVVPIWMFAYKMKKRSVDLYYSLPLKRVQILRVKYLLGLITIFAPYTVAFFLGALAAVIRFPSYAIAGEYYFAAYFASIPAIFCIYSIASFAFTRANRIIDGVVFIIFWAAAAFVVAGSVWRLVRSVSADMYTPFAPLNAVANYFSWKVEMPVIDSVSDSTETVINRAVGFTLTGLQAVAATVMLFLTERKSKAENIGGVSESPFGYKVMIPLLTVCCLLDIDMVQYAFEIYLAPIVAGAAFMLTALYRHTFKIGKVQAIIFASSVVLGVALSIAASYAGIAIYG